MSNKTPVPVPDMQISIDPVKLVGEILDCYKNVAIAREEQETRRTQIREQSRVCIAAIEADTKKFEMALNKIGDERMQLIGLISDVLKKDNVDEYSVRICEMVLTYLMKTNPMFMPEKMIKTIGDI